jgi:hypothetical protein
MNALDTPETIIEVPLYAARKKSLRKLLAAGKLKP